MKWELTDDDTCQYCRKVNNETYEFIEMAIIRPELEEYGVYNDLISLKNYSEQEQTGILDSFGYKNLLNLQKIYGEESPQIIAECIFEHYSNFGIENIFEGTKEEVTNFIKYFIKKKE